MKIKLFNAIGLLALTITWAGCKPEYNPTKITGFTQGTTFAVTIRDDIPEGVDIRRDIDSIFLGIEASMSLYDPSSLISRLNRNETDSVDRYIADCIRMSEEVSRQTDGLFDITIKPLTSAYGFTGEGATQQPNIDSLLQFVGYEKIRVENDRLVKEHPGVQLDLNGIAQGYTVDVVAAHFDRLGLKNYIVEMGGEIFSRGQNVRNKAWSVGIDRPVDGNMVQGGDMLLALSLSERGLATSGNYRKFYENDSGRKIVHTVNPKTGEPVISRVLATTVIAPDATLADVYGTYFMVAGLDRSLAFLKEHPELDALIVWADDEGNMNTYTTEGLEILALPE